MTNYPGLSSMDDNRYFEDYTVVGELERLVKQMSGKEATVLFRGLQFKLSLHTPCRHPQLDSIDHYSFPDSQLIPQLFNLSSEFYLISTEENSAVSLSVSSAKLLLSAYLLSRPTCPLFVPLESGQYIGADSDQLYSYIASSPISKPDSKCSAMVSLLLTLPSSFKWQPSIVTETDIIFPVHPFLTPIKQYKLKGIFPQADARALDDGLDALLAPIMLLSGNEHGPSAEIISQSQMFLVRLSELNDQADSEMQAKLRSVHSATVRRQCAPYVAIVLNGAKDHFGIRLFKAIISCLYDHHMHLADIAVPIIAGVWMEIIRHLREHCWKANEPLDIHAEPNWDEPLVFQKLSMFNYCISAQIDKKAGTADKTVRVLAGCFLHNRPELEIRVPTTQSTPPVMTSDQFGYYQTALQKYSGDERARLHTAPLLSDMQAFKAINPDCTLIDFLQWHSPKDIVRSGQGPLQLSERMKSGIWKDLWEEAQPASDQPELFSEWREAEKALFFLEDLSVSDLIQQLILSFPLIFDIDEEHSIISRQFLLDLASGNGELLVAEEVHRDRVQALFREHVARLSVERQCFAFGEGSGLIVKKENTWLYAKVEGH